MSEPRVTTHTPLSKCLNCGAKLDAVSTSSGKPDAPPTEGCLTVCLHCGAVMMLDAGLKVRGMTDAEIAELISDRQMMRHLARVSRAIRFVKMMGN
jgi:hypothetical protein